MQKLKSKSTKEEWRGNNRKRQCINGAFHGNLSGAFHGNLSGAFHGNHLRRHHKIAFNVELEKSTLPLPSHYQLFKSSCPMPVSPTIICAVIVSVNLHSYVSSILF
ncbi:hypothetical protein AVEN_184123-1 [Araneus ventricosus]|uniref:Uncharacterized protein n=1 Tax=Araneus ventricosus TaxID=182803 RepID=A0A4Y2LC86_ARAVE|nr:hypothetical protein AVEN_184123-1 [Araneus ventricosus]